MVNRSLYISIKTIIVKAYVMDEFDYCLNFKKENWPKGKVIEKGYFVEYSDGKIDWINRTVFEKNFKELSKEDLVYLKEA